MNRLTSKGCRAIQPVSRAFFVLLLASGIAGSCSNGGSVQVTGRQPTETFSSGRAISYTAHGTGNGQAILAWNSDNGSTQAVYARLLDNGTFLPEEEALSGDGLATLHLASRYDSAGTGFVAGIIRPYGGGPDNVFVVRKDGAGGTWTAPQSFIGLIGGEFSQVLTSRAGSTFLGWDDDRTMTVSRFRNGVWESPYPIGPRLGTVWYSSARTNDRGDSIVTWTQQDVSEFVVWANRFDNAASSWLALPERLSGAGAAWDPEVRQLDNATWLVVWQEDARIHSARYNGPGWISLGPLDNVATDSSIPRIASDERGRAVVVWRQFVGGKFGVMAAEYPATPGGGFTDPRQLDLGMNDCNNPGVEMDKDGNILAFWEELGSQRAHVAVTYKGAGTPWTAAEFLEWDTGDAGQPGGIFVDPGVAYLFWIQQGPGDFFERLCGKKIVVN